MVERRSGLRLLLEALEYQRIGDPVGEHLDRHRTRQSRVMSAIDFAHAADADPFDDFVEAESSARSEAHEGVWVREAYRAAPSLATTMRVSFSASRAIAGGSTCWLRSGSSRPGTEYTLWQLSHALSISGSHFEDRVLVVRPGRRYRLHGRGRKASALLAQAAGSLATFSSICVGVSSGASGWLFDWPRRVATSCDQGLHRSATSAKRQGVVLRRWPSPRRFWVPSNRALRRLLAPHRVPSAAELGSTMPFINSFTVPIGRPWRLRARRVWRGSGSRVTTGHCQADGNERRRAD